MYIRGLISRNSTELAEAVPIDLSRCTQQVSQKSKSLSGPFSTSILVYARGKDSDDNARMCMLLSAYAAC